MGGGGSGKVTAGEATATGGQTEHGVAAASVEEGGSAPYAKLSDG